MHETSLASKVQVVCCLVHDLAQSQNNHNPTGYCPVGGCGPGSVAAIQLCHMPHLVKGDQLERWVRELGEGTGGC
jgi:hypothetical protein